MSNKKKGKTTVTVYPAWCKGCGLCIEFCPAKVLAFNKQGKAEVVQEQECINCGFCEYHCPDFAIAVSPKDQATGKHNAHAFTTTFSASSDDSSEQVATYDNVEDLDSEAPDSENRPEDSKSSQ